jgi:acyl transferase domain-containing protein
VRPPPRSPIALVGIGCRFPGGITDAAGLWDVLRDGLDVVGEVPPERFDARALLATSPQEPGRIATISGGFLEDLDRFDASFFGLSPREALTTDPQQRLLATVAWEALEDAGLRRADLPRTATGLWFGLQHAEYERRVLHARGALDASTLVGVSRTAALGRLAAFLGVSGPALTIDSDRSSSLVALHLACESLRSGECSVALVGASNAILEPEVSIALSRSGMMAPGGRCRFGDRDAEGMVRSEGVCVLVLMPLERAVAEGLAPQAVVLASAVRGEGGASGDVLRPSSPAQLELLRAAWEAAGEDPRTAGYFEAHGTGTRLGDDAEIGALRELLGPRRADGPTRVGSVKTHLGHCEAAGGLAGLLAAALALRHGEVPPSLHAEHPIPELVGDETSLTLARELAPWPAGRRRLAGVSAFGLTGTLAHAVLAEAGDTGAPSPPGEPPATEREARACLLLLTAHDSRALAERARGMADLLESDGATALAVCRAAAHRREPLARRLAVVGEDAAEIARRLRAHADDEEPEGLVCGSPLGEGEQGVVMVFPGQGSQWVGMGRELFEEEPAFRAAIEAAHETVRTEAGWSLVDELRAGEGEARLDRLEIIQPLLVAVMIGLTRLWDELGVRPAAVCGTSLGEISAACAAGILSIEDALALACRRVALMSSIGGEGAMAAVGLTLDQAREAIGEREGSVAVAVHNSAGSQVIGGEAAAVEAIVAELEERDVFVRLIKGANLASHSPHMEPILAPFEAVLADLAPGEAACPMLSTATGEWLVGPECDAAYWRSNLRQRVDFAGAVERLLAAGRRVFLEVSPHPLLRDPLAETAHAAGTRIAALPTLVRDGGAWVRVAETFGALQVHGCAGDLSAMHPRGGLAGGDLPPYPWRGRSYWLPSRPPGAQGTDDALDEVNTAVEGELGEERGIPRDPERIAGVVARRLTTVLALEGPPDPDTAFRDLGLTSLLATELRAGLERTLERSLAPALLQQHPTLRRLSEHLGSLVEGAGAEGEVGKERPLAAVGPGSRRLPLLPAQATSLGIRALAARTTVPFPVTRVLGVRGRLDPQRVERTLELLIERHEALRVRLVPTPLGWTQELAPAGAAAAPLSLHVLDGASDLATQTARVADELRAGLDFEAGRLFAAGLVDPGDGADNALVLVLDHLIADLASERLLVTDFRALYRRLGERGRASLPTPPGSMAAWAEELAAGVASGAFDDDAGAWMAQAARVATPFPPRAEDGDDGPAACVVESLSLKTGEGLAEAAGRLHGADPPALVLGALAEVLTRRAGDDVCINLSSSGRLCPAVRIDASRTMGFFAIGHPTFFEPTGSAGTPASVVAAREAYARTERRVPMHAFRCHRSSPELSEAFDRLQREAGVVFNYRGELTSFVHPPLCAGHLERLGAASTGEGDVAAVVLHGEPVLFGRTRLNVVAGLVEGALTLWIAYPQRTLGESAARDLARAVLAEVEGLIGESS